MQNQLLEQNQQSQYYTPPSPVRRKPQEHNGMAEKKIQSFRLIVDEQYSKHMQRLFNDSENIQKPIKEPSKFKQLQKQGKNLADKNVKKNIKSLRF